MKSFVTLSLAAGAYASCCTFTLTASGGQSGTIGQLDDGQNRIGGGLPAANFCFDSGTITDSAGRGCLLTDEVEQFQCDLNKSPQSGFSIESNGTLEYSGSSVFYACPASDTEWNLYTTPVAGQLKCVEIGLTASGCGSTTCSSAPASTVTETVTSVSTVTEASTITEATTVTVTECKATSTPIYTPTTPIVTESTPPETYPTSTPVKSTPPVTYPSSTPTESSFPLLARIRRSELNFSALYLPMSLGPTTWITMTYPHTSPTSTPYWSNTTTASTTTSTGASTCVSTALTGTYTAGNYQYPHLIVPVSSSSPDTAFGTQFFGTISSNVSTIFNFDIPTSYSGHTCNLIFLLPLQSELETSSYEFSGTGGVDFEELSGVATTSTTYDNAPSVEADLGTFTLTEGSSTLISSFACPAGEAVSYEAKAVGDTYLYFFQDYNPSPLGLYITVC
ncbi:related to GPI anchored cell wall protein [Phialocephala subalpina]|uniref:Related to GPI anchored cell wall protein n=1 Tax=Phialocephala subalpina TaxID=576137 RepID=A0A1L7WTN4_9HELO|nr:related to GPI anchored cell wall protein [Phialocephala subalpina]